MGMCTGDKLLKAINTKGGRFYEESNDNRNAHCAMAKNDICHL